MNSSESTPSGEKNAEEHLPAMIQLFHAGTARPRHVRPSRTAVCSTSAPARHAAPSCSPYTETPMDLMHGPVNSVISSPSAGSCTESAIAHLNYVEAGHAQITQDANGTAASRPGDNSAACAAHRLRRAMAIPAAHP